MKAVERTVIWAKTVAIYFWHFTAVGKWCQTRFRRRRGGEYWRRWRWAWARAKARGLDV